MNMAVEQIATETRDKIRYWLSDPVRFTKGYLRADLWAKQQQIVQSVFTHRRTAVKSCHASGKTYVAAAIALAFVARFREAVVVTSAPTWGQVEKLLWGEVHKLVRQSVYPWPKPLQTELKLGPKRYMYGLSTKVENEGDEGVRFQGIHAENVLIILDEAPGIDPKIHQAAEAALSSGNAHILEIGNPTVSSGPFLDIFAKDRGLWNTHTISAFDTPNLAGLTIEDLLRMDKQDPDELDRNQIPYLISRRWVLEQYKKWGPKHAFWIARVMGDFPDQDEHALFGISELEACRGLIHEEHKVGEDIQAENRSSGVDRRLSAGVDVAGPGENETVAVIRDGPDVIHKKTIPDADPRGELVAFFRPYREQLDNINVDTVGIGYGVYLHLNDEGFPVNSINVGLPANDTEKFENLKAELYWGLRERGKDHELGGLDDDQIGQLATIRYEHTPKGKIKIESKDDMVKRGIKSPDEAEALMLSFAGGLDVWEKL